jgi:hypothetical protein
MRSRSLRLAGAALLTVATAGCAPEESTDPTGEQPGKNQPVDTNSDGDCFTDLEEATLGTDPKAVDSDGDSLTDCDEVNALGTNPTLADSDNDGVGDAAEIACVSDPVDPSEKCYACGWKHNDPGDLVSTGKVEGAVIGNMLLFDQCQESLALWDFATTPKSPVPAPAAYHILLMTAAW